MQLVWFYLAKIKALLFLETEHSETNARQRDWSTRYEVSVLLKSSNLSDSFCILDVNIKPELPFALIP